MFTDLIYKWLDIALDYDISEKDFWEMSIGELDRLIASKKRMLKLKAQEKASFDYILADTIGLSVARVYSSNAKMPSVEQVYPSLFNTQELQEKRKEKQDQISAIRFKQFADSFNKKFKEVAKDK